MRAIGQEGLDNMATLFKLGVYKVSINTTASIFHFGEISIPQVKKYLKEKGIKVY